MLQSTEMGHQGPWKLLMGGDPHAGDQAEVPTGDSAIGPTTRKLPVMVGPGKGEAAHQSQ